MKIPPVVTSETTSMTGDKKIVNKVGARTQPCFTPCSIVKGSDDEPANENPTGHAIVELSDQ